MSSSSVPSTVKRDARGCISVRTEVTTVGRDLFTARLRATLEALAQPDEPYVQRQALIDLAAGLPGACCHSSPSGPAPVIGRGRRRWVSERLAHAGIRGL
jgi:hypothetical protein